MGDSIGLARVFLSAFVLAVCIFIMNTVVDGLRPYAEAQTAGTAAAKGTEWLNISVEYFALAGLFVIVFGTVAYTVHRNAVESRPPRR
jgi:hypothetical protein